jgi:hypothetical protein
VKRLAGNSFTVRHHINFTDMCTSNKLFINHCPLEDMVNVEEKTPVPLLT